MKLRLHLETPANSPTQEDYDLPDGWDTWSDGRKRDYAMAEWETFRDNHANGSFMLVDDDGKEYDL